ncbi:hypothetical protein AB0J43_30630, partial [Nonomuraea fuscirosea]
MIRILIAEHLPLVRRGLLVTLAAEPGLRVVAEAGHAREVVSAAAAHSVEMSGSMTTTPWSPSA